jgi:hypothetical protein
LFHACDELYKDWSAVAMLASFTIKMLENNFGWQEMLLAQLDLE